MWWYLLSLLAEEALKFMIWESFALLHFSSLQVVGLSVSSSLGKLSYKL